MYIFKEYADFLKLLLIQVCMCACLFISTYIHSVYIHLNIRKTLFRINNMSLQLRVYDVIIWVKVPDVSGYYSNPYKIYIKRQIEATKSLRFSGMYSFT